MAESSQKFIARNRAPRVQIEYDVELYGAEKKVQLPFVMVNINLHPFHFFSHLKYILNPPVYGIHFFL